VLFGKTNVPTLLADWQTFNAIYGTTSNPWDPAAFRAGRRAAPPPRSPPASPD
jgi:amidase